MNFLSCVSGNNGCCTQTGLTDLTWWMQQICFRTSAGCADEKLAVPPTRGFLVVTAANMTEIALPVKLLRNTWTVVKLLQKTCAHCRRVAMNRHTLNKGSEESAASIFRTYFCSFFPELNACICRPHAQHILPIWSSLILSASGDRQNWRILSLCNFLCSSTKKCH